MALSFYTGSARRFATAGFDWVSNPYNIIIMTNTYTFSAAHDDRADLTNEVTGTGYTAGGLLMDNRTASAANPCVLDADDEVITQNAGGFSTGRKYAFAEITGGSPGSPTDDVLLAYGTAGADFGNVAGDLTLAVDAGGLVSISV